jgi:hypothetical protein
MTEPPESDARYNVLHDDALGERAEMPPRALADRFRHL